MRLDLNEGSVLISHCALDLLSTTHGYVGIGCVSIYRFPGSDRIEVGMTGFEPVIFTL